MYVLLLSLFKFYRNVNLFRWLSDSYYSKADTMLIYLSCVNQVSDFFVILLSLSSTYYRFLFYSKPFTSSHSLFFCTATDNMKVTLFNVFSTPQCCLTHRPQTKKLSSPSTPLLNNSIWPSSSPPLTASRSDTRRCDTRDRWTRQSPYPHPKLTLL